MTISNQSDLLKERRGLSSKLEEQAAQAVAWKDLWCTNQRGDGGRQPADDKADLSLKV